MLEFDVFHEIDGIRKVSNTEKRHLYVTRVIRRRKLVSFESDSLFSVNSSKKLKMQEFDVFREIEGIRNVSDTGKRHLCVICGI